MKFQSTFGDSKRLSFREALLQGQAPDRGLYWPVEVPVLSSSKRSSLVGASYAEVAEACLWPFVGEDLSLETLRKICVEAYNFEVPLESIGREHTILRLDRGPTASFKDFAARAMARWMSAFVQEQGDHLWILTATSGDTGSAIAQAFLGVPGIDVVVLFPASEVSTRQRKLMTTLGENIHAFAVDAKFDDCQAFVKRAFVDPALSGLSLSSANSINIGRLLPQSVYYMYTWLRLTEGQGEIDVVIPCGNFGNLMGAWIAKQMGAKFRRIVAAVNANDTFPRFLGSGRYQKIQPSKDCLSNAMNVGHPSNLVRLVSVYGGVLDADGVLHQTPDMASMRRDLWSLAVSDAE
ncbi:MAG: threonine synthase, partial [Myxococcota bacterium]